jgi:hypothetical protein
MAVNAMASSPHASPISAAGAMAATWLVSCVCTCERIGISLPHQPIPNINSQNKEGPEVIGIGSARQATYATYTMCGAALQCTSPAGLAAEMQTGAFAQVTKAPV